MPRAKTIALSIGAVYLVLTLACAARLRLGRHVGLRRPRPRHVDARDRRHGQLRQLVRRLQPGGALGRHRLHAARGDVLRPLRAVRPRRPGRALARQPDPHLPRRSTSPSCSACSSPALLNGDAVDAHGGARGRLQHGLDHLDDRLHLDRLRPLGAAGRDAVLLRDDDLRLLGLDRRRPQGVPLPAALPARSPARSGGCTGRTWSSCRTSRARAVTDGGARTRSSPSSCCSS